MDDGRVAHGLYSQVKGLRWHWADFPLFFLPAPPIESLYLHPLSH